MFKYFLIIILFSAPVFGADLFLKNESGKTVKVKVENTIKTISVSKTEKFKMSNLFKTDVDVFYQNKRVTSTKINSSHKDLKFRIYRKNGAWLIEPDKYHSL